MSEIVRLKKPIEANDDDIEHGEESFLLQREHWAISLVKQLGLPTALLMIMILGTYQATTWFGSNVLIPLTDRQLEFIDQVDKSVQKITTIIEEHQKNNNVISRELEGINAGIKALNSVTEQNGDRLLSIEKTLNKGNTP